ncbi:uncharacterized protein V1516DRAFT_713660 [Lipomyces oligophaga]|uniref:uncharacterized protein n=1 Tax=Lipomyces oligophaga TaxID=45792 RepID=UPI0034CD93BB
MADVEGYLKTVFGLQGKTALVTGATRGIGHGIALAFAKAGAHVIMIQRSDDPKVKNEIEALGGKATVVVADLSDREQVKAVVPKVVEMGFQIDILLNCGGIQRRHPCAEFPDEDWDAVLQVNLTTPFLLCRAVGKHILDRKGKGKIINVASLNTFQGGLTIPAYASSKGGIGQLTKSLSNEWISQGINVNAIAPGYVATDMNEALIANPTRSRQIMERIPAQRWGSPDDFEGAGLFLASNASNYVSGEILLVDGGWMGR